tara:strand:- start:480 stop:644 length:165 start_codon:yes stop_codon:yes gene_type:complete
MKKSKTKKELINELLTAREGDKAFLKVFTYDRLNRGFTVDMLNFLLGGENENAQ